MTEVSTVAEQDNSLVKKRKLEAFFNVSPVDEPPKQPRLEEEKKQSTMGCVVCWGTLAEDGIVPCVLTRCRPVAHVICLACCEKRRTVGGLVKCPTCAIEGEVLPIASAVDETKDEEAKKLLDTIRFRGNAEAVHAKSAELIRLTNKAVTDGRMALIQKRLDYIIQRDSKSVQRQGLSEKYPNGRFCMWTNEPRIPQFDKDNIRLRASLTSPLFPKKTTKAFIRESLRTMALELKPFLKEMYADSNIKISIDENDQESKGKFVYLKTAIKFK